MRRGLRWAPAGLLAILLAGWTNLPRADSPVVYRVSAPEPEHHWLQIEATFTDLDPAPFHVRMSRSSPGRYAVHEFAKNIFSIEAFDGRGGTLALGRDGADSWRVDGHHGTVRLVYRVFGDRADGTYLGVDSTHAHINMPAAFLWGVGLDARPISITFVVPDRSGWRVGTQLFATADPFIFTAPNLQYFMDSPTELSNFVVSRFSIPAGGSSAARFRLIAHAEATQSDVDALAASVERLLREEMAVFGEFPRYEPGEYTFLLDALPWVEDDGMEHRNSTSISWPGVSLHTAAGRRLALDTISHEFFHNWNVERIRPVGIEPFDFTRENVTCCLWLAEGFTSYYADLLLMRAGFSQQAPVGAAIPVMTGSARQVRTAVEMSEYAPFIDRAVFDDLSDQNRTFISYYTYGDAIALALDLSIRANTDGRLSLDDYMRRLWRDFGADGQPGYVARPYTLRDLRTELAALTGQAFADDFFDRFVEGHAAADYAHLLQPAGFVVRPAHPGRGWIGSVPLAEGAGGLVVGVNANGAGVALVPFDTPLYEAGVDEGDVIVAIDGKPATRTEWLALGQRAPGDRVRLSVRRRDGTTLTAVSTLRLDPAVEIVPVEQTGIALTDAQRRFRGAWLGSRSAAAAK